MERRNLSEFEKILVPIVLLDNCFEGAHIDTVAINNAQGSYEAVRYLIEMGHTKIGYLQSSVVIDNFVSRKRGFQRAMEESGIQIDEEYMFYIDSTVDGSFSDMSRLLESAQRLPTAVFADNDIIALGAMKAMKEFKIRVPEDISIIGFDDMPYCELSEPPLSTVRVFKQYMGRLAVRRLLEKIEFNSGEFVVAEVGTQLIKRRSVCKLGG